MRYEVIVPAGGERISRTASADRLSRTDGRAAPVEISEPGSSEIPPLPVIYGDCTVSAQTPGQHFRKMLGRSGSAPLWLSTGSRPPLCEPDTYCGSLSRSTGYKRSEAAGRDETRRDSLLSSPGSCRQFSGAAVLPKHTGHGRNGPQKPTGASSSGH